MKRGSDLIIGVVWGSGGSGARLENMESRRDCYFSFIDFLDFGLDNEESG